MGGAGRETTGSRGTYEGLISPITVEIWVDGRSLGGTSSLRGTSSLGVTRKGVYRTLGGARKEGTARSLGGTGEEAGGDRSLGGAGRLGSTRKEARVNRSWGGTTGTSLGSRRKGTVRKSGGVRPWGGTGRFESPRSLKGGGRGGGAKYSLFKGHVSTGHESRRSVC